MIYAENKKAKHDFSFLKEYVAGIKLLGFEVKAVRVGKVNLKGSHVIVRGGEAFVVGMHISPYQPKNTPEDYDPERPRKLLLQKKEIEEIAEAEKQKGLTVVPVMLYNKGAFLKLKIATAKGKKKHDKREEIKKRDIERELRRSLKNK